VDGFFVAGVIAGEAHFSVVPNNGGQGWRCLFSLRMRADDTPLVRALRDFVGFGQLRPVPARGRSKPQTAWTIDSSSGAARLAEVLTHHPMLNKKAGEAEIWSRAVDIWRSQVSDRWSTIALCARELKDHRAIGCIPDHTRVDISRASLDGFLSGFCTAEAHFGVVMPQGAPRFAINLRADERAVLDHFASAYGIGQVHVRAGSAGACPTARWCVGSLDDLNCLARVLDRHPPQGRQGRVYTAWRALLDLATEQRGGPRTEASRLLRREFGWRVRLERVYTVPAALPQRDRAAEQRERGVEALQSWASQSSGPFTATAYEASRRAGESWPSRNTIARTFGSWHRALREAGLPTNACLPPERAAAIGAARTSQIQAQRDEQRRAIAATIIRCRDNIGRWPGAAEFFRWRLDNAPETPSQMTVYRCFPQGWQEALAAARRADGEADPEALRASGRTSAARA
jgi:hypothetical protein